jgi:cysteine synthase A
MIKNVEQLIGNTPIVRLKNIETPGTGQIYVKLENFNLGGSIKDRVALGMIQNAESNGTLRAGMGLVEPTSGNTGIAIALLGQLKGYPVTIVMPESMSMERRQLIRSYGAKLILSPANQGMNGSIKLAEDIARDPQMAMLQQFQNPQNPRIHYLTTAQEIMTDLPDLDVFITAIGTGGTISGIGKQLKEHHSSIKIVGLEPAESAVISGQSPGIHKIQGIGAGFIPETLDLNVLDDIQTIESDRVITQGRRIYTEEGLFLGISSVANILAASDIARYLSSDKKVLTIAPDGGSKYLSTDLYGGKSL